MFIQVVSEGPQAVACWMDGWMDGWIYCVCVTA
jgi:hypothetical protein